MGQHEDTCTALGVCLSANHPVILWGGPGEGKSSVIRQIAADLGLHLETVIASIREPSDFAGLPVVNPVDGTVHLAAPRWARTLVDRQAGVLFLDEISTAPPAVQAALLRVVLDRVVGDLAMPDDVRVVAAANPPGIAADGWDLAPPMANRFCHLTWRLPAETVRDGFTVGWPAVRVPNPDPQACAAAFTTTRTLVAAFLGARPELVSRVPASAEESGGAFPTPRSWETAAWLYAVGQASGVNTHVLTLLLVGSVGESAANEFLTYIAHLDLPDPEDLLRDPDSLHVPSDRGDKVYAIAASVWQATAARTTPARWAACGRVLAKIADANHADIAYTMGTRWAAGRPEGGVLPPDVVITLGPIMTELGLLARQG